MNTVKSLAESLDRGRRSLSDADLARKTGLTRQSIARALSGHENFNVTTLLAIAEATGQQVLIVPSEVARAIEGSNTPIAEHIRSITDNLKSR